ncbi:MAG: helix-turn-helix domain-containing protein [Microthrixaceae bacterium]|nr:helix-turn-helix domain-containing protein [Microthrixaceae bacterium]
MSTLQVQAKALGDPTRHGIFQYVAEAEKPVGVAELTGHFGLNHNAIRQHLAKLVEAKLLVESTARPQGRGRPRLQYVVDPRTESRWGVTGPYERLSVLLAEMVRTGDSADEIGHRAGLRHRFTETAASDPVEEFAGAMAQEGFAPALRVNGDSVEVRLEECPFVSAALTDPQTVCDLHLGLARGVAEALGGIEVEELRANDPRKAHCLLRCHRTPDAHERPTTATEAQGG